MIAKFLAAYWQYVLIVVLLASNAVIGTLWFGKATEFVAYKAEVRAAGIAAEAEAERIKKKQDRVLEELSNAYAQTVPIIQANAVANYRRLHPSSVQQSACASGVPAITDGAQGASGTNGVGVSTCEPDAEFLQRCASAVAKVGLCRDWIQRNDFPGEQ